MCLIATHPMASYSRMDQEVDVQIEPSLSSETASFDTERMRRSRPSPERSILLYWVLSIAFGLLLVGDWLTSWNVGRTLGQPGLLTFLLFTFALSQVLYILVARHDGRPFAADATLIFAIGNGICETLAFASVFRLGINIGSTLVGLFAPTAASVSGFILGLIFFSIYGGLIHGLFWLRVLPPHLDNAPRSRAIRKIRPLAEVGLVLGWSLCMWLNNDIWTVVILHVLVDIGLMLRVRPRIFAYGLI